jgi:O-antigen ligase
MSKKRQKKDTRKISSPIDLYFLIISAIIILPLIYTSNSLDPNLASRLLFLGIFLLGLYIINLLRSKLEKYKFEFIKLPIFPVLFIYLIWSVFTLTVAKNPAEGLFDITKTFLVIVLLILTTQIILKYERSIPFLTMGVIISSIISSIIGLSQYLNNVPGKSGHEQFMALYKVTGLMAQKNQFSIMLFLMLPFAIYGIFRFSKYWKSLSLLSLSLIILDIVLIQTRAVWVASITFLALLLVFGSIFFLKKQKSFKFGIKTITATAVISIIIITGSFFIVQKTGALNLTQNRISSIFDKDSHDNQGRLQIWESTLNMSKDNLIAGVGPGNWKIEIPSYFPYNIGIKYQNWRRPHNDFLWVLSEKGIVGLVLYVLIFLIFFYFGIYTLIKVDDFDKKLITVLIIGGITGYLVISMFTFPMERINHQIYIMIMMAIVISNYYLLKPSTTNKISELFRKVNPYLIILIIGSIYFSYTLFKSEVAVNKLIYAREKGNWKRVIKLSDEAFSKLITLDAFSSPIHLHRGEANIRLKNNREAEQDLKTALKYFPDHISVLNNLAIVSYDMNNHAKAIEYLEHVLEIYPKYEASIYNKANLYHRNKDYENAFISLLSCSTKTPRQNYHEFHTILKAEIDK